MTKVTILGQEEPKKELKKIEFVKYFNEHYKLAIPRKDVVPSDWKNIELICKDYSKGFDLMFAFSEERNHGTLFLGHFNDGIV